MTGDKHLFLGFLALARAKTGELSDRCWRGGNSQSWTGCKLVLTCILEIPGVQIQKSLLSKTVRLTVFESRLPKSI